MVSRIFLILMVFFIGCTDYSAQIEEEYAQRGGKAQSAVNNSELSQPDYSYSESGNTNNSSNNSSNTFVDARDGNVYTYRAIAGYTWMMEDLRYGGGLYSIEEAFSACPEGWRLPGNEYSALVDFVKEKTGSDSQHDPKVAEWLSSPKGFNMEDGSIYWTSNLSSSYFNEYYHFAIINGSIDRYPETTKRKIGVRCVK